MLDIIQKLCKEKGTSIFKLEKELGFGNGTIYKWDKSSPAVDKLKRVAEYLGVSTDFLLYGFNKGEFTSIVNLVRHNRSVKKFASDTGLDEHYLTRLCSGMEYKQPSIDTVLKIAIENEHWLVDANTIFNAAGYDLEEVSGDLLEDIPLELLHHYQEKGMSGAEMAIAYAEFREAEYKDAMSDPGYEEYLSEHNEIETIAAHHDGEEWTEEELEEIERFKEFVRMKRGPRAGG